MQKTFQKSIIGAIEQGDYRFMQDKLGNNYLAVVPLDRAQIEYLQLRKSRSFGATRTEVLDELKSGEFVFDV